MIEKCQFDLNEQGLFWSIKQFENSLRSITKGFQSDKDYQVNKGIVKVNRQIENGLEAIGEYFLFLKKLFPQLQEAEKQIVKLQAKIQDDQIASKYIEPLSVKMDENLSQNSARKRGPYRFYTLQERTKVIELRLQGHSFAKISKDLKIPQKNIVRWCKEGLSLTEKRRRVFDLEMEQSLLVWIEECRMKREQIKIIDLQMKALSIRSIPSFKASRGWVISFLRRYNLEFKYNSQ